MPSGMLLDFFSKVGEFIGGVFSIIPKLLYFIVSCVLSLIDLCQVAFRKLAGLDPIMISDKIMTGDTVYKIITDALFTGRYPAIQTIFWALIILGIFMLFITSIIAVIRLEYNPDKDKGNSKAGVIKNFFKALFSFAVVPIACLFGMYLAGALVQVVDKATAYTNIPESSITTYFDKWSSSDSKGDTTDLINYRENSYYAYNVFALKIPTTSEPFSSIVFKACAYGCNRVRKDPTYFAALKDGGVTLGIFDKFENNIPAANVLDQGFAMNAKLKGTFNLNTDVSKKFYSDWSSWIFNGLGDSSYSGLTELSKYNVNGIYYFYDLWSFNYIIAFVAMMSIGKSFYGFVLFLMQRLFEIVGLFLISPIPVSLMPLDNGDSLKQWRVAFITKFALLIVMILSLNLVSPLISLAQNIKLFGIDLVDYIVTTFFLIAALNAINALNSLFTKILTGDDKNWGQVENSAKGIQGAFSAGLGKTMAAAKLATAPVSLAAKGVGKGVGFGLSKWNAHQNQKITDREEANARSQLAARQAAFNSQMSTLNAQKSSTDADMKKLSLDAQMYADYNQQRGKNAKQMHTADGQADMQNYLVGRGYSATEAQEIAQRLKAREDAAIRANTDPTTGKMVGSLRTAMDTSFSDDRTRLTAQQSSIDAQIKSAQSSFDTDKATIDTNRQQAIDNAINSRFSSRVGRVGRAVSGGIAKVGSAAGKVLKPYGKSLTAVTGFNPYVAPKEQDLTVGGLLGGTVYTLAQDKHDPYNKRSKDPGKP